MYSASIDRWMKAFGSASWKARLEEYYGTEIGPWQANYQEALQVFAENFGDHGDVVVARCPGQMNIMGMHIDYGGMPSLRLAVRGADTLTIARKRADSNVRLASLVRAPGEEADRFPPVEFDLAQVVPPDKVDTRQKLLDFAGQVCQQREAETGSAQATDWGIMPQGQLIYLESYFRDSTPIGGLDMLVWSNVSPSGGMSSSSALVISTAHAALGAHGLRPHIDLPSVELVDGVGTSEWIRGTRGGTGDHGGMVLGRSGQLVSVGVFPSQSYGQAPLPEEYAAVVLDSGVPRIYDEAGKEETVIAYPLGVFLVRDLLLPGLSGRAEFAGLVPDYAERIHFIRDITEAELGLGLEQLYQVLEGIPCQTSLAQLRQLARAAGCEAAFQAVYETEVEGKFPSITPDYPIYLRRRFIFGLTEQDRVQRMLEYMAAGRMDTALELVRISHDGDLDTEVTDAELAQLRQGAAQGQERARLCFVAGGYGRMTDAYDRVARRVNEHLLEVGGPTGGAVQRLGAGWGGNVGGLVHRSFLEGPRRPDFERLLGQELGLQIDLDASVAVPGEGACLWTPPETSS
ncbi:MAG: hypothetical protein GKR89_18670 [Candidatus Latescibacteria bacterium]|nr:hypothetical protein [Candidatus Latescibacterota bacterium]